MSAPRPLTARVSALAFATTIAIGCVQAGQVTPEEGGASREEDDAMSQADLEIIPAAQPGAEPFGEELRLRLAEALAARGTGYRARTKHSRADGSPLYTNRLLLESSPYLHQHAHNPVNWYPWGEEAFEAARRLGRPILLSIGYSTCHWCHVMEEESFEDLEIATFMNEHYIAVKVDREVRPDVDAIYMQAVQLLTRGGGWPLNVWLTPEGEPFYGGTYFPARDGDRGARAGFLSILREIGSIYREEPEKIARTTEPLTRAVRTSLAGLAPGPGATFSGPETLQKAAGFYRERFDGRNGGMRGAPKFPSSLPARFLLRYHRRSGDEQALEMATLSLERMARGGMYDQIGGGFHRYSVDELWLVPHFEKMLYDNALLAMAYVEGWQATGREDFAETARDILSYVTREMTSPEGAFYSATDADSLTPEGHRDEGWFFTWTPEEIREVVGEEKAAALMAFFGASAAGNFEGRNILHRPRTLEEAAASLDMKPAALEALLAEAREPLYRARARRSPPLLDDKILAAWNGLMISAFARAGLALREPELTAAGARAADFILSSMRKEGRLYRSYREGRPEHPAFVEDYAFLIAGLLDLFEADGDPLRLRQALELQEVLDRHYLDEEGGGYFTTSDDHEKLLAREKPGYDGAEPTGNSVTALNLLRLEALTGRDEFRQRADRTFASFSATLAQSPAALSEMLLALDFRLDTPKEIVLVKPFPEADLGPMLEVLARSFVPNRVISVAAVGEELASRSELLPLLEGRLAKEGKVTAYVCENRVCKLPTTDPEELRRQITAVRPLFEPAGDEDAGPMRD